MTMSSQTRGVVFVHSAPRALCTHVEWALGGLLGAANLPVERMADAATALVLTAMAPFARAISAMVATRASSSRSAGMYSPCTWRTAAHMASGPG